MALRSAMASWCTWTARGSGVQLDAQSDVSLLWLAGEPIDEPLAGRGPFVMNSEEEILQAIQDFRAGHFGHLAN